MIAKQILSMRLCQFMVTTNLNYLILAVMDFFMTLNFRLMEERCVIVVLVLHC